MDHSPGILKRRIGGMRRRIFETRWRRWSWKRGWSLCGEERERRVGY